MTKTQEIAEAALRLRVHARKRGYISEELAWDSIAEVQGRVDNPPAISAKQVIRKALAELKANGENIPVRG